MIGYIVLAHDGDRFVNSYNPFIPLTLDLGSVVNAPEDIVLCRSDSWAESNYRNLNCAPYDALVRMEYEDELCTPVSNNEVKVNRCVVVDYSILLPIKNVA